MFVIPLKSQYRLRRPPANPHPCMVGGETYRLAVLTEGCWPTPRLTLRHDSKHWRNFRGGITMIIRQKLRLCAWVVARWPTALATGSVGNGGERGCPIASVHTAGTTWW
eukprot:353840-Chlamydomonas_euryale.AAC.6